MGALLDDDDDDDDDRTGTYHLFPTHQLYRHSPSTMTEINSDEEYMPTLKRQDTSTMCVSQQLPPC